MVEKHAVVVSEAPWPTELEDLVENVRYRPGWTYELREVDRGPGKRVLMLKVVILSHDTYDYTGSVVPEYYQPHYFVVPPIEYDREAWMRWLLDRLLDIDVHESCEFFMIGNERPFAPSHAPDSNPYKVERAR